MRAGACCVLVEYQNMRVPVIALALCWCTYVCEYCLLRCYGKHQMPVCLILFVHVVCLCASVLYSYTYCTCLHYGVCRAFVNVHVMRAVFSCVDGVFRFCSSVPIFPLFPQVR